MCDYKANKVNATVFRELLSSIKTVNMKTIIAFAYLAIVILGYSSCTKQTVSLKKESSFSYNSLQGDWELRTLIGCQVPGCNPNFNPGNGNIWRFTDSTFEAYADHKLVDSGRYYIGTDTCLQTNRVMDFFVNEQRTNLYYNDKIFFEFVDGQLILYRGVIAADGTIQKYSHL